MDTTLCKSFVCHSLKKYFKKAIAEFRKSAQVFHISCQSKGY